MKDYLSLALSMLVALEDFSENDLGFNKDYITKLIKEKNLLEEDYNERACILLWKNGYLTHEKFAFLMDVEYEDKEFWLVFDDFEDILGECNESSILDSDLDFEPYPYYECDIPYYWKKYTEKTLKNIIDFCVNKGFEIDEELITNDNLKYKNNDIYFNDQKLVELIDEDGLEELKTSLNISIIEAQESADISESFQKVKKAFENEIGRFKWKEMKIKDKVIYKLLVVIEDLTTLEKELANNYGNFEFFDSEYGNLKYAMREFDMLKMKEVYLDNIYGTIDNDVLNEYTQHRLDWD